jgi:tetratricopeptide (TPR) repeat protein
MRQQIVASDKILRMVSAGAVPLFLRCVIILLLLTSGVRAQYAGSRQCQSCHSDQFAAQAKSEHAKALAPAAPGSPGEWAFGAGRKAITYVSQTDEETYVERADSYYASSKSMGVTPGHQAGVDLVYPTFAPSTSATRCFRCHSTGDLTLSAGFALRPAENGIHCEVCHGPGAAHVAAGGGAATIRNPKRLNAVEMNEFCGTCHRKPPEAGDENDWANPWNVRHQPASLSQAVCFRKSAGGLSCLTCHDPHAPLSASTKAYDQRCSECHHEVRHRTVTTGVSCVTCHMPQVEAWPGVRFTNHWIGIYTKTNSLLPVARSDRSVPPLVLPPTSEGKLVPPNAPSTLRPLFAQAVTEREKALGPENAKVARSLKAQGLFLRETGDPKAAAIPLRRAMDLDRVNSDRELFEVEEALAQVLVLAGNRREAFELFQQAAAGADLLVSARSYTSLAGLDPAHADSYYKKALEAEESFDGPDHPRVALLLNRLALTLAQKENFRDAEPLLRRALAIQRKALGPTHFDTAGTLVNLGSLLQNLHRAAESERLEREAISILEQVRPQSVELATACTNLADLLSNHPDATESVALLRRAIKIDEAIYGTEDPEVAVDLTNLGELLKRHGQDAAARPPLLRALAIYEKRLGPDSPQARDVRESLRHLQ